MSKFLNRSQKTRYEDLQHTLENLKLNSAFIEAT